MSGRGRGIASTPLTDAVHPKVKPISATASDAVPEGEANIQTLCGPAGGNLTAIAEGRCRDRSQKVHGSSYALGLASRPRLPFAVSLTLWSLLTADIPRVEVGASPDAGCSSGVPVSAAWVVPAQGQEQGREEDNRWRVTFRPSLTVPPYDGALWVELRDPTGSLRLSRNVPAPRSLTCDDLAEAVVVMVERYFADIRWTNGKPAAPDGVVRAAAPAAAAAPARAVVERLRVSVGPAVSGGRAWAVRAAIDGRLRVAGPIVVAVGTFLPGETASEPIGASARADLEGWAARLSLAYARRLTHRLAVEGGADGLFSLESGSTAGSNIDASKDRRLVVAAGPALLLSVRLSPRWALLADVAAHVGIGGSEFTVTEGAETRYVLNIPRIRALASLRLAFVAWD